MDKARERTIDELLVVRCQEGCGESFDLLVRRWQHRLWRYARRLTGSDDVAWDVTQDTWIAVLARIRKLSDPAWFAAWVYRIAQNKCADHFRKARRRQHLADSLADRQRAGGDPTERSPGDGVAEALRRLTRNQQELVMLKYSEELNILEIALILDIPPGTVKSRLHNAREKMRRILEGDES